MSACEVTQDLAHIADGRFAEQRRRGEDFQASAESLLRWYQAEESYAPGADTSPEPAKPRWFRRHAA